MITTTNSLPRNKTGLFAGDTLQEIKTARHQSTTGSTLPPQFRILGSSRSDIKRSFSINESDHTKDGIRNGFRPSSIRRQKSFNVTTSMIQQENSSRDLKDVSPKRSFTSSPASATLKSEIDQLNNQLKAYGDVNKILRQQNNRDTITTPQSSLSYATSYRISSASTNHTNTRIHRRYSNATTHPSLNTLSTVPGTTDISDKFIQHLSGTTPSLSIFNEEYYNQYITHAYQIPQRSNIGSECILPPNPPPPSSSSSIRPRSTKPNHRYSENKLASCPFYVMYFTNLVMQQHLDNENDRTSLSKTRKGKVHLHPHTSHSRHQSIRRRTNSPLSMNATYSPIDDDNDSIISRTSYYNNKHFTAKIAAFENENSHMLKDVLRTTSWNHVQVKSM